MSNVSVDGKTFNLTPNPHDGIVRLDRDEAAALVAFARGTCNHNVRDVDYANNRTICRYCGKVEPLTITCTCGDCEKPQHQQVLEEDGAAQAFVFDKDKEIERLNQAYLSLNEELALAKINVQRLREKCQNVDEPVRQELNKLRDFKQRVHDMLDDRNIPKFEGEDCRVAHRLGDVFNIIKIQRERLKMIKRVTDGL